MLFDVLASGLRQGAMLVPLALGVHVAFRLARYPDLTPEGSLIIGGTCSMLVLPSGHPILAILCGMVAGGALSLMTSILSECLHADRVLAGIGTSLCAYSLALRFLGRGNVALSPETATIYSQQSSDVVVSLLIVGALTAVVAALAASPMGLKLRVVGENEPLARILGGHPATRMILGLFWANCCVGLSGALLVQHQRFVDVGQGAGTLFIGLASVLLGTAMPGTTRVALGVAWSGLGAILYACVIAAALRVGLMPGDLRALTAIFVLSIALLARYLLPGERLPLFG